MTVVPFSVPRPDDLLITGELFARPQKAPDLKAEVSAFHELSTLLAADPRRAIHRFLELALALCDAGSAGLSLCATNEAGESICREKALGGPVPP